jgi:multisubunit Na+/H+ antiporter MnhE subunit
VVGNLFLALLLVLFWASSSGIFSIFLLSCGAVSIVITYFLYFFLIKITEDEFNIDLHVYDKISNIFILSKNIFNLIGDIAFCSIRLMLKIIFNKKSDSSVLKLNFECVDCNARLTMIAHHITMTPGSISILQDEKNIYVHCIDVETSEEMKELYNANEN